MKHRRHWRVAKFRQRRRREEDRIFFCFEKIGSRGGESRKKLLRPREGNEVYLAAPVRRSRAPPASFPRFLGAQRRYPRAFGLVPRSFPHCRGRACRWKRNSRDIVAPPGCGAVVWRAAVGAAVMRCLKSSPPFSPSATHTFDPRENERREEGCRRTEARRQRHEGRRLLRRYYAQVRKERNRESFLAFQFVIRRSPSPSAALHPTFPRNTKTAAVAARAGISNRLSRTASTHLSHVFLPFGMREQPP